MKIPTYDTPQVEERALPGVRQSSVVSPELLNAEANRQAQGGKAMLSAGANLLAVAALDQDRQNADMLFRAETSVKDDYLKFEQSVRERKGQNAWGATKDTEAFFADQEKKHSEALENDVQRKLFGQTLSKLRQSAMGSISNYETGERQRSLEESNRASIVGTINIAAAQAADGTLQTPLYTAGKDKPEGMVAAGNIDLASRPRVKNDDSSISTVRSISVNMGGQEVLIPTVVGNRVVSNEEAIAEYKRTGNHLGKFSTPEQADAYAESLHQQQEKAYAGGSDPLTGFKADISKRVQVLAGLNGWSPERRDAEEAVHLTNLHKQVIQNLVERDPVKAREYFNANKAEINGTEYDAIGNVLKQGETKDASLKLFFDLQGVGGYSAQQKELDQRYKDGKITAEVHDGAMQRIEHLESRRKSNEVEWKASLSGQATDWLLKNPEKTVQDMPIALYNNLKNTGLLDNAVSFAHSRIASARTDPAVWFELNQRIAKGEKPNLLEYAGKLSTEDMKGFEKKMTEDKPPATWEQQKAQLHNTLGWGSKDMEKKGMFDRSADAAFADFKKSNGRAPDWKESQALLDRLTIEGDVNGWMPGGHRRLFEVQGTPDAAKFAPKISDSDRMQILERFQKRTGRKPTEDEIIQTFKTWKGM